MIDPGATTVIGESFGNYVGNAAAARLGGMENILALNPAATLGGYTPPNLKANFHYSTALETSSLYDTQRPIAGSNYTLDTGDINDPIAQHAFGVAWLTG